MSDGKKFAKTNASLSPEERLEIAERNFSVILERIQSYDQVLSEFSSLKKELKQANQNIASLHDFCDSFSKEIRSSISSLSARVQPLKGVQDSHEKAIQSLSSTINALLEHSSNYRNETKEGVDQLNNKLSSSIMESNKIASLLDDMGRKVSVLSTQQSQYSTNLDKLYSDYFKFKDSSESISCSLGKEIRKVKQSVDDAPDLTEWANKIYTRIQSDLGYRDKQATAYVDKKVETLSEDFAANPLSAESIKASLFNEIQNLSLDGKNAYLKSNNCATQIQILEKKLERLNIILKKYELNK